jgi:hypothetical protein
MMGNANDALAVWDALAPKLRQLIREETRTCVRKKRMNLAAINTAAQTVTVYEPSNPVVTITVPYTSGIGIEDLSPGQAVMVEWTGNDFATAVAAMPGRNFASVATPAPELPAVTAEDDGKALVVKDGVWGVSGSAIENT